MNFGLNASSDQERILAKKNSFLFFSLTFPSKWLRRNLVRKSGVRNQKICEKNCSQWRNYEIWRALVVAYSCKYTITLCEWSAFFFFYIFDAKGDDDVLKTKQELLGNGSIRLAARHWSADRYLFYLYISPSGVFTLKGVLVNLIPVRGCKEFQMSGLSTRPWPTAAALLLLWVSWSIPGLNWIKFHDWLCGLLFIRAIYRKQGQQYGNLEWQIC